MPHHWARLAGDELLLFLAHPATKQIRYPMPYGLSAQAGAVEQTARLRWNGHDLLLALRFEPNMPLILAVDAEGVARPKAVAQQ